MTSARSIGRQEIALTIASLSWCGGARLVPPGPQGARQAYRVLVERRGVFLTWADARRPGIAPVPAFGRPLPQQGNLSAVVRLARATSAHPIPAYVERQAGAHFHTTFGPPVT